MGTDDGDDCNERQFFPLFIPPKREALASQSSNLPSIDDFISANNWEPHAQALADSLVVPLNMSLYSTPKSSSSPETLESNQSRVLEVEEGSLSGSFPVRSRATNSNAGSQRKFTPSISMTRQGTPVPSLDNFVTEYLGTRGPLSIKGSIRAWSIEYDLRERPVSFTYQMQRNRFCELIGRSHKSNNIFWTVDINSWTCIQGCHDPDCFGRGSPVPISNSDILGDFNKGRRILDNIKKQYETWQEEEFEKALMNLNLDDIGLNYNKTCSLSQSNDRNEEVIDGKSDNHGHEEKDEDQESSELGTLSDDALLQACLDNPELFP